MGNNTNNNLRLDNLKIGGMSCAVCANRIEKGLGKMVGVDKAVVNFAVGKAAITYDAKQVSLTDIAKKVA